MDTFFLTEHHAICRIFVRLVIKLHLFKLYSRNILCVRSSQKTVHEGKGLQSKASQKGSGRGAFTTHVAGICTDEKTRNKFCEQARGSCREACCNQ